MLNSRRLDAPFGVEVTGLDLASCDDDIMRALTSLLYENQVMVIRDQKLDKPGYLDFGRRWGEPIPHVLDHMRMPDFPEMMTVGNTEERDRKSRVRNGAALWHTDQSYEAVPASTTMLYSIKAPTTGGETQFCNMALAWQQLEAGQQASFDGVEIAHKYGYGKTRASELAVNPLINDDQDKRVPAVYHPLVMRHPITGRKALYATGHGAHGVRNMDDVAADTLIESLKDHVLQEEFIYRHAYRPGDLVIWDTLATMHSATPIDEPASRAEERLLWRISVRNKPAIYRNAS